MSDNTEYAAVCAARMRAIVASESALHDRIAVRHGGEKNPTRVQDARAFPPKTECPYTGLPAPSVHGDPPPVPEWKAELAERNLAILRAAHAATPDTGIANALKTMDVQALSEYLYDLGDGGTPEEFDAFFKHVISCAYERAAVIADETTYGSDVADAVRELKTSE